MATRIPIASLAAVVLPILLLLCCGVPGRAQGGDGVEVWPVLAEAARLPRTGDENWEAARALLPGTGYVLADAATTLQLAARASREHVPFLVASLDRVPWPERARVAERLARLDHPQGVGTLRRGSRHLDPAVRTRCFLSLDVVGALRLSDALRALVDPDDGVAQVGLGTIDGHGWPLDPEQARDPLMRLHAPASGALLSALDRGPDTAGARELVQALLDGDTCTDPDTLAVWLFRPGRPGVELQARAGLRHALLAVRARAVEALGREAGQQPTESLRRALEPLARDPSEVVRCHVARALGGLSSDLARVTLVLLTRDPAPLVRESACDALARHEPYHVLPVLRPLLADLDDSGAVAAACALLIHGSEAGLVTIARSLDDPLLGPRARAALDDLAHGPHRDAAAYEAALDRLRPGWRDG